MLFISNIVSDVIKNAVKVGEANKALLEHFSVEKFDECPCCMEELCYTQVEGLCGHRLCLKCYGLLGKKTCPLCRADYKDINKPWYREMVSIKREIDFSRATYKLERGEDCSIKDCEDCEEDYALWKDEIIRDAIHSRTKQLSPELIGNLLHSYGYAKAVKEHVNMFGDALIERRCCGIKIKNLHQILCHYCGEVSDYTKEQERALLYNHLAETMCNFFI